MDSRHPQARKDLNTWRYYNSHFNVEQSPPQLPKVPLAVQPPPPSYKNASKLSYINNHLPITKNFKSDKPKMNYFQRFVAQFDEYCDMSSLHGLKYVGMNSISKIERAFWFIAFLIAVGMAIFFISNLYLNYDENPVIIGFNPELIGVNEIPFPAVTICNVNVALKRLADEVYADGSSVEKRVLADLCNAKHIEAEGSGTISWPTMQKIIINVTQKCSEMIVVCKWQGKIGLCKDLINAAITDDGYCCTFNKMPISYSRKDDTQTLKLGFPENIIPWNPENGYPPGVDDNAFPYRSFGRGIEQGLSLVLDANLEEYYCSTTSSLGFKMIFATPLDSPKVAELGFLVPPGIETRITINAQVQEADDSIRNIHWKKRKCFFARERPLKFYKLYSARNCLLECESNFTLKTCRCVTFDMPRGLNTKLCDKSDDECVDNARFQIERYGPNKAACNCLPGCFEIAYTPSVTSVGKLSDIYDIVYPEYIKNVSKEYFSKNMAIVHIFYSVDKFQKQTKSALYGFSEFLSNTGGLLGLFMGFSFLSVVEIIYFLFLKSLCKWGHNKLNNNKTRMHFVK